MGDSKEEFQNSTFHTEDGMNYEDFLKIKKSKSGRILIKKISENCGYLRGGEAREGFTPIFAEDFSCYVYLDDPFEDYYYLLLLNWYLNLQIQMTFVTSCAFIFSININEKTK
jgi:hypothetical protein